MIRRPPRSTRVRSSAASDVYKRQDEIYSHLKDETKNKRRVKKMIHRSVLPFKLKRTEERITARSGLALYAEFMKAMRVTDLVNEYFPKAGSGNSYKASEYIT